MISSKEILVIRQIVRKLSKEELRVLFRYLLELRDTEDSREPPSFSRETD